MISKIVYRCNTEWDLGLNDMVFESKALALEAMREGHDDCDVEENFEELLEGGLYSINKVILYG